MKQIAAVLLISSVVAVPAPAFAAAKAKAFKVGASQIKLDEVQVINCPPSRKFLSGSVRGQLQSLAKQLKGKSNLHLEISGHVDEQKLSDRTLSMYGDKAAFSRVRAQEAADFLHAQPGLDKLVIEVSGQGDSEPKVQCDKKLSKAKYEACLAPNRRVEVRIRSDKAGAADAPVAAAAVVLTPATASVAEQNPAPAVESKAAMDSSATAENRAADAPVASDVKSAATAPAVADNMATSSTATVTGEAAPEAVTQKAYYATADLGLFSYSNLNSAYDGAALPNPAVLRIGGGYRFNQRIGVEAGYSLVGDSILKSTGSVVLTETVKAAVLHVAAVGTYSINGKFDVFGKLGLASTKLDYSYASQTTVPATGSGSGTKTNLMFGLGVQYNFNKCYSVRAQYEDFGKTHVTSVFNNGLTVAADIGVTVLSMGGVYNF